MKKHLSIFLAIIFLAMQMGSFAHMAKYGFEHHHHSHDGGNEAEICQIGMYFQASQGFDSYTNAIIVVQNNNIELFSFSLIDDASYVFELSSFNLARAPPHIS